MSLWTRYGCRNVPMLVFLHRQQCGLFPLDGLGLCRTNYLRGRARRNQGARTILDILQEKPGHAHLKRPTRRVSETGLVETRSAMRGGGSHGALISRTA